MCRKLINLIAIQLKTNFYCFLDNILSFTAIQIIFKNN
jgi:hypothetical protein